MQRTRRERERGSEQDRSTESGARAKGLRGAARGERGREGRKNDEGRRGMASGRAGGKDQEEGRSRNKEQPGRKVPEGVAESRRPGDGEAEETKARGQKG